MNGRSDVVNRHWSCTFGGFCVYMKFVLIRYYISLINWKKLCRMKLKCFFFSDIYDLLFHFNRIKMVIFSNIYDLLFHHIKFDKIMHTW